MNYHESFSYPEIIEEKLEEDDEELFKEKSET